MNYTHKLIRHRYLDEATLRVIIQLKSLRWQYSEEQQRVWIEKNIFPDDVHLLVYSQDKLIAYTNFVATEVEINGFKQQMMGIGNVCTRESGKGYGDLLMKEVNRALVENNWRGILLCKDGLVPYYEKYNWCLVNKEIIKILLNQDIFIMLYNIHDKVTSLSYTGRSF